MMVTFPIGLDQTPDRPRPKFSPDQTWREPITAERPTSSGIDWEHDEKYFSPKPAGKRRFGQFMEPLNDIPETPVHMINVKARPPATRYYEGVPIPADRFIPVPITPDVLDAIKVGDLERGPDVTPGEQPEAHAPRRPRRPPQAE